MPSLPIGPPVEPLPQEPSIIPALLSYLIPGLGQLSQGRYGKGLLFMVSLLGMFFVGQALGNWQNVFLPPATWKGPIHQQGPARSQSSLLASLTVRWHYAGQFWIGMAAWPALWQYYDMPVPQREAHPFWHDFQKMPQETDVNAFLVNSDKTPDLGWVYTVIAGMLNILVIYDAYAGAAFAPRIRTDPMHLAGASSSERKEGI